jgi:iron complex transport system substrate-binding protein
MRRLFIALFLLLPLAAQAADVTDATGRVVAVPDNVARVLPAGPPAAVLLEALAPDLMLGWPFHPSKEARALLAPAAAGLPTVPRVTGKEDVFAAVVALKPDLIVDYGDVNPGYVALAEKTQQRTGIPTLLLNGALDQTPAVLRQLGVALHRSQRAEQLAKLAEQLLALPVKTDHPVRVLYARGADGLTVAAPETSVTAIFTRLGYKVLAPSGQGTFRPATLAEITALDPDEVVFSDPRMRQTIAASPEWRALRAVREGHALVDPAVPFGWVEEPPSLNRLLGLGWFSGMDPGGLAARFYSVVYGHDLSPAEVNDIADAARPLTP